MSKNSDFQPRWTSDPPPAGSYRSIFKWGDPAVFKHPNKMLNSVFSLLSNLAW